MVAFHSHMYLCINRKYRGKNTSHVLIIINKFNLIMYVALVAFHSHMLFFTGVGGVPFYDYVHKRTV